MPIYDQSSKEFFQAIFSEAIQPIYQANKEIINNEPGIFNKLNRLIKRGIIIKHLSKTSGSLARFSGLSVAEKTVGTTVKAAAFFAFYYKDNRENERIERAKNFAEVIKKISDKEGIESIISKISEYLASRFLYILREMSNDDFVIFVNFFALRFIDIVQQTDPKQSNLNINVIINKLIPIQGSEFQADNFLDKMIAFLTGEKNFDGEIFSNARWTIKGLLYESPCCTLEGQLLTKRIDLNANDTKPLCHYPMQCLSKEEAEKAGYREDARPLLKQCKQVNFELERFEQNAQDEIYDNVQQHLKQCGNKFSGKIFGSSDSKYNNLSLFLQAHFELKSTIEENKDNLSAELLDKIFICFYRCIFYIKEIYLNPDASLSITEINFFMKQTQWLLGISKVIEEGCNTKNTVAQDLKIFIINGSLHLKNIISLVKQKSENSIHIFDALKEALKGNNTKHFENYCKDPKNISFYENNINITDYNGNTMLHLAAENLNFDIINQLKNKEADFQKKNKAGLTPLHIIISKINADPSKENEEIIKLLNSLKKENIITNAIVNDLLLYTLGISNLMAFCHLVEKCDINFDLNNRDDLHILTLFLGSAYNEYQDKIDLLLPKGFKDLTNKIMSSIIDQDGNSFLHEYARDPRYIEQVRYLIKVASMDLVSLNEYKETPLHFLVENYPDITMDPYIGKIVKKNLKTNKNLADRNGDTLLHYAIRGKNITVIVYLVKFCEADYVKQNNKEESSIVLIIKDKSIYQDERIIAWLKMVDFMPNEKGRFPFYFNYFLYNYSLVLLDKEVENVKKQDNNQQSQVPVNRASHSKKFKEEAALLKGMEASKSYNLHIRFSAPPPPKVQNTLNNKFSNSA